MRGTASNHLGFIGCLVDAVSAKRSPSVQAHVQQSARYCEGRICSTQLKDGDMVAMKRLIDLTTSGLALLFLSWLIVLVALLVRIKLGKPVLFVQERPGRQGKIFKLFKFRSMNNARSSGGELLPDHQRITPFGAWLRATSLDELPQLFNVFKGDMSLVGPRPLLTDYLPLYSARQAQRHDVRPGITGLAQVNGRNNLDWDKRFELDIYYVKYRSFWLDLKIIAKTLTKVINSEGVNKSNCSVGTDLFQGNVGQLITIENPDTTETMAQHRAPHHMLSRGGPHVSTDT